MIRSLGMEQRRDKKLITSLSSIEFQKKVEKGNDSRFKSIEFVNSYFCVSVLLATGLPVDASVIYSINGVVYKSLKFGSLFLLHDRNVDSLTVIFEDFNETFDNPEILSDECFEVVIPQDPCISRKPVNYFNLFRWHVINSPIPIPQNINSCGEFIDIPFINLPHECEAESSLYMSYDEEYQFYINLSKDQSIQDSQGLLLSLVDIDNYSIIYDFGSVIESDGNSIYSSFSIPESVSLGSYRLIIYTDTNSAVYVSNKLTVLERGTAIEKTVLFQSRNFSNRLGFNYEELPDFKTSVRLHIRRKFNQPSFETNEVAYKEITTGKNRSFANESEKVVKFQFIGFDRQMVDALQKLIENSFITLNGIRYSRKGNLSLSENFSSGLMNGEFELYENTFSELNRN